MKPWREIQRAYTDAISAAITEAGSHRLTFAQYIIGGVPYKVSWGVRAKEMGNEVVVDLEICDAKYGTLLYNYRGDFTSGCIRGPLREAIDRGWERLIAWREGGEFPATADELFAPLTPPEESK